MIDGPSVDPSPEMSRSAPLPLSQTFSDKETKKGSFNSAPCLLAVQQCIYYRRQEIFAICFNICAPCKLCYILKLSVWQVDVVHSAWKHPQF